MAQIDINVHTVVSDDNAVNIMDRTIKRILTDFHHSCTLSNAQIYSSNEVKVFMDKQLPCVVHFFVHYMTSHNTPRHYLQLLQLHNSCHTFVFQAQSQ